VHFVGLFLSLLKMHGPKNKTVCTFIQHFQTGNTLHIIVYEKAVSFRIH